MMIDMGAVGKVLLGAVLILLGFGLSAEAASENEQAWIFLERGRNEEAMAQCAKRPAVLSRWVVALAEVRLGIAASDAGPASESARAFEDGDFAQAAEILKQLLDNSPNAQDRLHLRLRLGACLVELGSIVEAEQILTEVIEQAHSEQRLASECYALLTRGRARVRLRQVQPPRDDLETSLALSRRLETHRWAGVAAIALSVVSRLQMDLDDALYWREAALAYYRHAGDLRGQARALHYIAAIGIMQGELTRAMTQLQDASKLARQADSESELGGILGEMAAINYLLGDFDKALDQYGEALRLAPNPWRRGMMLVNIGSIHEYLGQFDQALPALEEALELMRQVGDHRSETIALQSMGEALCEMGQCEEGLAYLEQAIQSAREYDIPLSEASAQEIKGHGLLKMGDIEGAAVAFEVAIELAERIGYFDVLEWALLGRAQVARHLGQPQQSLELLKAALAEVSEVRRRSGGSSQFAGGIVNQASGIYDEMVDLLYEMHGRDKERGYDRQAYNVIQEARIRGFLDLMVEAEYDLKISTVSGYRRQEGEILNRIIGLEERLAVAQADSVGSLKARLAEAENEMALLEARLRTEDPRYAEVLYPSPLSSHEVRRQVLQPGEILLEFALGEKASYLWVLSADDMRMVPLPGAEELEAQVRDLLPLLSDYNMTGSEAAWFVEPSRQLHRALLEPVAEEIASADRLIICADGILHYLPFEALLTTNTSARSFAALPWLVNEKIITYTPSASILGRIRQGENRDLKRGPWLLVGDPKLVTGEDAGLFARAAGVGGLPALPFAAEELLALAALAPSEILAGDQATRNNLVRAGQRQDLGLVHFASHGLYNEARPRYSGLVVSPDSEDDGFLSISEVLALNLNCDQVVLSACASALGPHITGEGLVGLTRSFMFAGARSVVSALWDVSGQETARFMEIFYGELAADRNDRAQSLATAKRAMIASEENDGPDVAHPVFWAAFVLSGDGR